MENRAQGMLDPPSDLARLAGLLCVYAPYDGHFNLRMPGLEAIRASRTSGDLVHGLANPALCIVAQGAKKVFLGSEVFDYDASQMLVYSVDLPISGQITKASPAEPFLCLKVELDPERIANLTLRVYPNGLPHNPRNLAISVTPSEPEILRAAARLVELMAGPEDAEWIAPLMVEEILIRLLRSPIGGRVAQIGQEGSRVQRVAKAVSWVRTNFDRPLDVERLAGLVNMSVSTFHQHFKAVTAMSPLQYQKVLRLHEARRLMLAKLMDAGTACRMVGYLSASQFTREYGRFFGAAPMKDIAKIREGALAGSPAEV